MSPPTSRYCLAEAAVAMAVAAAAAVPPPPAAAAASCHRRRTKRSAGCFGNLRCCRRGRRFSRWQCANCSARATRCTLRWTRAISGRRSSRHAPALPPPHHRPHPLSPTLAPPAARQCSVFTDAAERAALVAVACFGATAISLLARMSKWPSWGQASPATASAAAYLLAVLQERRRAARLFCV